MKRQKGQLYKWLAKKWYGGDEPVTLIFDTRKERDAYCSENDYCNKDGKIREDHIYDAAGNHFGIFVAMRNGKFFDTETGIEM